MKAQIKKLIDRNRRNASVTPVATKGGISCTLCSLPTKEREALEAELTVGNISLASVGRRYSISRTSAWRHVRNHLLPTVRTELVKVAVEAGRDADSLPELSGFRDLQASSAQHETEFLYKRAVGLLNRSEGAQNWVATRGFLSECRQLLELYARLSGELAQPVAHSSEQTINVFMVPPGAPVVNGHSEPTQLGAGDVEFLDESNTTISGGSLCPD